jgi:serine/threonine protein kinase
MSNPYKGIPPKPINMSNPYKGIPPKPINMSNPYKGIPPKPLDVDNEIPEKVIRKLDETFTDTTIQQVEFYSEGYTGKLYKFYHNRNPYLLKMFKKIDGNPFIPYEQLLPDSVLYEKMLSSFTIDDIHYQVFRLLENYITLDEYCETVLYSYNLYNINGRKITNGQFASCYLMDEKRWKIINDLFILITELHKTGVYHRDLHTKNIMIHKETMELKIIDLDSSCISDQDCNTDKEKRYNQNPFYTHPLYLQTTTQTKQDAMNIDWYSIGIICLEILCNLKLQSIPFYNEPILIKNIKNKYMDGTILTQDLLHVLQRQSNLIYPSCSIHERIYNEFCSKFLIHFFTDHKKFNMRLWYHFYDTHFKRENGFFIKGEGNFVYYYENGLLFNRVFEHIITHTFPNKKIYLLEQHNNLSGIEIITKRKVDLTEEKNKIEKRGEYEYTPFPSLIIRAPFYYSGTNCSSAYDFGKTTIGQELIQPSKLCKPDDPYYDDDSYHVPYISLSIEPMRCRLNPYQLPLFEINTILKDARTIKNVPPYDTRLFKPIMWWGNQLGYFDEKYTNNQWIPYLVHYYCDIIPFNQEEKNLFALPENITNMRRSMEGSECDMDFIFIAKNCTSQLRNDLFKLLEEKDEKNKDQPTDKKRVRSYGKCMNNTNGKSHEEDNSNCFDYKNKDNVATGLWTSLPCAYQHSKFVFAIENVLLAGYISEKIMIAFQSGGIPIYYGPQEIKKYFNVDSFFYINDRLDNEHHPTQNELKNIADELWALANDDSTITGWKKYLKQPIFKDNKVPELFQYKTASWMENLITMFKNGYESHQTITSNKKNINKDSTEGKKVKKRNKDKSKKRIVRNKKSKKFKKSKKRMMLK